MPANGAYLGVTPPISTEPPTERHKQITESLMTELRNMGQFESAEEARQREIVLSKLNTIVKDFVYGVSKMKKLSESMSRESGGKIFTFGSYRLGVHGPGADIDTLAVGPRHVTREDFFEVMVPMLKERQEVQEMTAVPEAFVPIIKLKFSGIEVDLIFVSLQMSSIPDDLSLGGSDILRGLSNDEAALRSVNGSRVTDEILRLVPDVLVFRDALRTIKLWAKRRAIYSNIVGFCGGVVWAMLVARICQLYPNECAGGIISKFFIILQNWNWPTPILLKQIEDGPLGVKVWNPSIYPTDKAHRMPVITPAYPSMCSTHNVSMSTQSVMTKEFKRAADIVDRIVVRSANWSELFEQHDFFNQYKYYLQITASSVDPDVQLKWSGLVESKLRLLVKNLEFVDTLTLAHPYVEGVDRISYCLTTDESHVVMSGEIPQTIAMRTKEEYEGKDVLRVHTTSFFIGLMVEPKDPNSNNPRKLDIAYPTSEFTKLVKGWERFEQDKMGIVVRHVKVASKANKPAKTKNLKRAKSEKTTDALPEAGVSPAKRLRAAPLGTLGANGTPEPTAPGTPPNDNNGLSAASSSTSLAFSHPHLLDGPNSNNSSAPQTPGTESATVGIENLRTSTPSQQILQDPQLQPGAGAVKATNAMPGSVLPSAASLATAAHAQAHANDHSNGQETKPIQPQTSNGIPGIVQAHA